MKTIRYPSIEGIWSTVGKPHFLAGSTMDDRRNLAKPTAIDDCLNPLLGRYTQI